MKTRKIATLILAMVMALALALPLGMNAFAAGDGKIVITPPDRLVLTSDDAPQFKAYKLFDVLVSPDGVNHAYEPTLEVEEWLLTTDGSAFGLNLETYIRTNEDLTALASALKDAEFEDSGSAELVSDGNVEITGLDYGYYLVTGQGSTIETSTKPDKLAVMARGAMVTITSAVPTATIALKADAPTLTKTASNSAGGAFATPISDVKIGDTVYFKITSEVPDMTGYSSYTYKITDTLGAGLTINPSSVAVKINDEPYTGFTPTVSGQLLTIDFTSAFLTGFNSAGNEDIVFDAPIVVTYNAVLNTSAAANNGATNSAALTFSNDPDGNGTGTTLTDTAEIKLFSITVTAVNNETNALLPDAEFKLKKGGAYVQFIDNENGTYRVATDTEISNAGTTKKEVIITDSQGKAVLQGLNPGSYTLENTVPPEGFNKADDESINIVAANVAREVRFSGGSQLPITGGIGEILFVVIGIGGALAVAAAVVYYTKKRRLSALKTH
ncbi:MAG: isopeptide-forming domain-containing fimbrial protein [Oscillospiraceae bacterium]|nr:isopeptide-forming domain-containing fimbrial protein [Oscillospiraceae bacterium]